MFTGFTDDTIRFFLDLRFHNETSWFHANHDRYVRDVQQPFYALIEDVGQELLAVDPGMELRPYRALARLHRDTRFTKDKSPYRDHLWVLFRRAGEPREGSLFYWFELGIEHVNWGMGTWGDNRNLTDLLRKQIEAKPEEVLKIIRSCPLAEHQLQPDNMTFARMQLPPGVPLSLQPWFTAKAIYITRQNIDRSIAFRPELKDVLVSDFRAMAPIYRLLRGMMDTIE